MSARMDEKLKANGVGPAQLLKDWGHTFSVEERVYLQGLIDASAPVAAPVLGTSCGSCA